VLIASLSFRTKKAAKEFFRDVRDRYEDGERVTLEDDRYLRDLIAIHPEAEMKIGCGISHFSVDTDSQFGTTRHFVIHRCDGSSTDVSFLSAIDGRNARRDRLEALRRGVDEQILDFRSLAFSSGETVICPLRGVTITESSYHIDHEPPQTFLCLVDRWCATEALTLMDLEITPPADNQIVTEMTNDKQLRSWQEFHRRHAKLRLLSPLGNLSDAKLTHRKERFESNC
jgi:hypothetical protein